MQRGSRSFAGTQHQYFRVVRHFHTGTQLHGAGLGLSSNRRRVSLGSVDVEELDDTDRELALLGMVHPLQAEDSTILH